MRGLSFLLLLFGQYTPAGPVFAHAGGGSIAFVSGAAHGCYANSGGSALTTLACTVTGATATDTFVVFTGSSDTFAITLADSGSGTIAPCSANPVSWLTSGNGRGSCFTVANIGSGSHTLTTTFGSASNFPWIQVLEFSGANTTTPQDVSVGAHGNGGTTMDSGALTTGNANEMLVAFCQIAAGGVTVAPGVGFTLVPSTDSNLASEYQFKSSIGTYNGTCTGQTAGQDWVAIMVALK